MARLSRFIVTLILAKLLTPEDFGILAIGLLIVNILYLFREVGLGAALIQRQDEWERSADTAFYLILFISLFIFTIAALSSGLISGFFNHDVSRIVVVIFSSSILITAISKVHLILFQKELLFKKQAIAEIISMIAYCVLTISLAYLGYKFWSLIIGYVISELIRSLIFIVSSDWRPKLRFSLSIAKDMFDFGKYIFGNKILLYLFHNLDQIFVGKLMGNVQLGFYNFGYRVANLPAQNISKVMGIVTFPLYAKIQNEQTELRNAFLWSFHLIGFVAIPVCFTTIFIVPRFFHIAYGDKWDQTIPILKILSVYGLFRSFGVVAGSMFTALRKPKCLIIVSVLQTMVVVSGIYFVSRKFGLTGIALMFTGAMGAGVLLAFHYIQNLLSLTWHCLMKRLVGIVLASFLSFVAADYIINRMLEINNIYYFGIYLFLISSIYLCMIFFMQKHFFLKFIHALGLKND